MQRDTNAFRSDPGLQLQHRNHGSVNDIDKGKLDTETHKGTQQAFVFLFCFTVTLFVFFITPMSTCQVFSWGFSETWIKCD